MVSSPSHAQLTSEPQASDAFLQQLAEWPLQRCVELLAERNEDAFPIPLTEPPAPPRFCFARQLLLVEEFQPSAPVSELRAAGTLAPTHVHEKTDPDGN